MASIWGGELVAPVSLGISFASKNRKNHLIAPPARRTRHSAPRQTHAQHPTDLWDDLAWTRAVAGAAPVRARAYNPLPVLILTFSTFASAKEWIGGAPAWVVVGYHPAGLTVRYSHEMMSSHVRNYPRVSISNRASATSSRPALVPRVSLLNLKLLR